MSKKNYKDCPLCNEQILLTHWHIHWKSKHKDLDRIRYRDLLLGVTPKTCSHPKCNNKTKYQGDKHNYQDYCCIKCRNTDPKMIKQQRYKIKEIQKLRTKEEKLEIENKRKQTNLKRYGYANPIINKNVRNKHTETLSAKQKELFNVIYRLYITENKSVSDVAKELNIHGETIRKYCRKFNVRKSIEDINKYRRTKPNWTEEQRLEHGRRIFKVKRQNNTFHTSKPEKDILSILKQYYSDVRYQYFDKRYPYSCDFYIPSLDLFIEYQGTWTHNIEPFNPVKHSSELNDWIEKSKTSDYYKSAINTWTVKDPEKLKVAKDNNINILLHWDFKDPNFLLTQIRRQTKGLKMEYTKENLINEFNTFAKENYDFNSDPKWNRIINHYQSHFFEVEQGIWKDPAIQRKLILNREKYLYKPKEDITDKELLRGFKISGINRGFSHFCPFWIKSFIQKYNIKSIYDPCGGWGHRLLGALDIKYIYNDIDKRSCESVKSIVQDFEIKDKIIYNQDASQFTPIDDYECVFTCPPYFNTEKYTNENTSTSKYPNYYKWLDKWWRYVIKNSIKPNTKYFAFVISNRYKDDMNKICYEEGLKLVEEIKLGRNNKSHFQKGNDQSNKQEYLVVMRLNKIFV